MSTHLCVIQRAMDRLIAEKALPQRTASLYQMGSTEIAASAYFHTVPKLQGGSKNGATMTAHIFKSLKQFV